VRSFTNVEFEQIRLGLVPRQMEDKWFIFHEVDRLYLHRSWSGHEIYHLRFTLADDGGAWVAEPWVNRDPDQYKCIDDAEDVALLGYLIDRLLLGREVRLPIPPKIDESQAAIFRHGVVGYARSNDEEP
jgi:hypothetical protein